MAESYYQHIPYFVNFEEDADIVKEEFEKLNPDGRYSLNELFPGVTSGKFIKIEGFYLDDLDEQILKIKFFRDSGQGTEYKEVLCPLECKMYMDHTKRQFCIDTRFGVYYLSKGDLEIVQKFKGRS